MPFLPINRKTAVPDVIVQTYRFGNATQEIPAYLQKAHKLYKLHWAPVDRVVYSYYYARAVYWTAASFQ